jgi:uncharacterized protein (DUF433 family)
VAQKTHLSLRLRAATLDRLARRASRVGELKTSLAARYVEEGLRMEEHPGIVFRSGPAGRRAGLAGHRLDVWQVIETVRNEAGDLEAAAGYLDVSPGLVAAAVEYYGDHADEIDAQIAENTRLAEEMEAAWRRRRSILAS